MIQPSRVHSSRLAAIAVIVIAAVIGLPVLQPARQPASVSIEVADPSPLITLGDYLVHRRQTTSGPFSAETFASQSGRIVPYTVSGLTATEGVRCVVRWTERDLDHDRPAEESDWRYDDVLGWPDGLFEPDPATGAFAGEIFVPRPNPLVDVGRFVIRLELVCGDKTVDTDETEPFRVDPKERVNALTADGS
jgi:energy-converting hydrogenase Eha subunit A